MMSFKPIRTPEDHGEALKEIESLWQAQPGSTEFDRLEALAILVEDYERRQVLQTETADPIAFLQGFMAMNNYRASDLGEAIGSRPHASEILSRRRPLTIEHVRRISATWHVPADLLVSRYELVS
jgi:HTH-type transcriptional regulator/antitoxin HigA